MAAGDANDVVLLAPSDDLGYDDRGDEELSSGVPASGRVRVRVRAEGQRVCW